MRKLEEFVNEKLKVTNNSEGVNIKTTLRKFMAWWHEEDEFSIYIFDFETLHFVSSDKSMTKKDIADFLYRHMNDEIDVYEEEKKYLSGEQKAKLYDYSFDIDGITFSIDARIFDGVEPLSKCKEYIIEKLKVTNKNVDTLQVELADFITWYMYDDNTWGADDLEAVDFAENTTSKYFNGSYKKLYEFITKHKTDVIYVSEEYEKDDAYAYSFELDGIPFEVKARINDKSELLSNQWRILIEKLKVTPDSIKGNIKSTLKGFLLWYNGYETTNNDLWDAIYYMAKSVNDVLKEYFNDNMNDFADWVEEHMDDIVYFDEIKDSRESYTYTFTVDEITFKMTVWISPENVTYPFSKSEYIIKRLY